jgi:hypothetical protein
MTACISPVWIKIWTASQRDVRFVHRKRYRKTSISNAQLSVRDTPRTEFSTIIFDTTSVAVLTVIWCVNCICYDEFICFTDSDAELSFLESDFDLLTGIRPNANQQLWLLFSWPLCCENRMTAVNKKHFERGQFWLLLKRQCYSFV